MPTIPVGAMHRRLIAGVLFFALACIAPAQAIDIAQRLDGFDAYVAKVHAGIIAH
jgi:hypothetical protein